MNIKEFLEENNIEYIWHEHPAVYTCEEAEKHCSHIPGLAVKNLFLRDKKGKKFFLLITTAEKRVDLKKLGEIIGINKVSFASPDNLKDKLGLEPGAVSPFGLLNDKNNEVGLYIDNEVMQANIVSFHPNVNTASIELSKEMFKKFTNSIDHEVNIVKI
jgi:Ala-tRNA(Pro) deacylase